jgi:hypothetical protein
VGVPRKVEDYVAAVTGQARVPAQEFASKVEADEEVFVAARQREGELNVYVRNLERRMCAGSSLRRRHRPDHIEAVAKTGATRATHLPHRLCRAAAGRSGSQPVRSARKSLL